MLKINKFLITAFSFFAVGFLSTSIQAKVAPAPIEDLIRQTELIVVGKVVAVSKIEGVNFAKVEMLQTLKGVLPPNPFRIQKTASFKETVERLINNSELFRLSFDGRGRMPIQETISDKKLQISSGVILPKDLKPELTEIIKYTNKVLSSD